MKRSFEEIVAALFTRAVAPRGRRAADRYRASSRPDEVTLRDGDEVRIAIDGVGVLRHHIYQQTAGDP